MMPMPLRIALFSGNYNYVRDGANQALNRLVNYLERQGMTVKVFSPVVENPAFPPEGELIGVPSIALPRRPEYRLALGLNRKLKAGIRAFDPHIFHLSAPDWLGWSALRLSRKMGRPAVASLHTRFESYLEYYGLDWLEPLALKILGRFYGGCQRVLIPSSDMADFLRGLGVQAPPRIWSRGVDRARFNPARRDMAWRRGLGFRDDQTVILFVGRLVLEKGIDVFARTVEALRARGRQPGVLVAGDGPERAMFAKRVPDAVFTGFLDGIDLARAYASADAFLNPSVTETFGNVTLEALASGLPCVCANASGSKFILNGTKAGITVPGNDIEGFASALERLMNDPALYRDMAAAALARASEFEWDATLSPVLACYYEALSEMPPRFMPSLPPAPPGGLGFAEAGIKNGVDAMPLPPAH